MIPEKDTEHVEHLALETIPERHTTWPNRFGTLARKQALQPHALFARDRLQVNTHLKAGLGRIAVDGGHRAQSLELQIILRKRQVSYQPFGSDLDRQLPQPFRAGQANGPSSSGNVMRASGQDAGEPMDPLRTNPARLFPHTEKPANTNGDEISISTKPPILNSRNHDPRIQKNGLDIEHDEQQPTSKTSR